MEEQLDKVLLGIYQIDSPVGKLKHNDQESCTVGFMSRLVMERFSETEESQNYQPWWKNSVFFLFMYCVELHFLNIIHFDVVKPYEEMVGQALY